MTSVEQHFNSFDQEPHKWESLNKYVKEWIEQASIQIENLDADQVQVVVGELNEKLRSEGLIGVWMQVKTVLPGFYGKTLTEHGVGEAPIVDIKLLQKDSFEGEFKGLVAMELTQEPGMHLLFYDVEISEENDGISLRAPVDGSKVKVDYEEEDTWEEDMRAAFTILESVQDDEFAAVVEDLQNAFWNTGVSTTERIQTIGFYTTELLLFSEHMHNEANQGALGSILLGSLEDELSYHVSGISVVETQREDGSGSLSATSRPTPRIMRAMGVEYITNFEVIGVDGEVTDVQLNDTPQPAFVFYDVIAKTQLSYPMRFITNINELEYNHTLSEVRPVFAESRINSLQNDKTCGEQIHDYWQNHPSGV